MNLLIQKDFTPEKYVKLCKALKYSKKITYTMSNFLKNDKLSNNIIIIRHDVDIFPIRALKMAIIESKFDIQSTYYFRMREKVYDEKIIIFHLV